VGRHEAFTPSLVIVSGLSEGLFGGWVSADAYDGRPFCPLPPPVIWTPDHLRTLLSSTGGPSPPIMTLQLGPKLVWGAPPPKNLVQGIYKYEDCKKCPFFF
jgi:hypothetical protein